MKEPAFDNVWKALESDAAIAENLKLRLSLMIQPERYVKCDK
jgi:predicted XRE-type DNA-binding protein